MNPASACCRALALACLLLASGCASLPGPDLLWRLQGKLSFQSAEETRILSLDWRRGQNASDIHLRAALGVKVATVRLAGKDSLLITKDGAQPLPEALARGKQAASLPFDLLLAWLDQAFHGRAAATQSAGAWRLAVLRYQRERPSLLELTHPRLRLRLKIKSWS